MYVCVYIYIYIYIYIIHNNCVVIFEVIGGTPGFQAQTTTARAKETVIKRVRSTFHKVILYAKEALVLKSCPTPLVILYAKESTVYIPQRGVQWKRGVVIAMRSYASAQYDTTPIHCTPLPLHPPVMNTNTRA